ncbi:MAG: replication-associated recombination protein A, partial [Bacteroidota bacterium]
ASEDVGNADPHSLMVATAAMQAVQLLGMPEGRIPLAQATAYLASAPKSNAAYKGLGLALEEVRKRAQPPVPLHLRNAPTQLMKDQGYGKDYIYPHDVEGPVRQSYWPDEMTPRKYYRPTEHGFEAQIKKRLDSRP